MQGCLEKQARSTDALIGVILNGNNLHTTSHTANQCEDI
jgi:hypothetical protein